MNEFPNKKSNKQFVAIKMRLNHKLNLILKPQNMFYERLMRFEHVTFISR